MNPAAQIGINAAVTFSAAFGAAIAAGQGWKVALAAGFAALAGNQIGLYQRSPLH